MLCPPFIAVAAKIKEIRAAASAQRRYLLPPSHTPLTRYVRVTPKATTAKKNRIPLPPIRRGLLPKQRTATGVYISGIFGFGSLLPFPRPVSNRPRPSRRASRTTSPPTKQKGQKTMSSHHSFSILRPPFSLFVFKISYTFLFKRCQTKSSLLPITDGLVEFP